ncbi:MAG: hypothetical protein C0518_08200 [Opitutus sp.]|nr:hypothetical protein [Opitutus sp.]
MNLRRRLLALLLLFPLAMSASDSSLVSDLVIETASRIPAPRAAVWSALTTESALGKWFGYAARVELREAGPYEIFFLKNNPPGLRGGEGNAITSFLPGRLLTFTWNAPPDFGPLRDVRTHVLVELTDADGGTHVKLTHYGFRSGDDWKKVHAYFTAAWPRVLANLQKHCAPAR